MMLILFCLKKMDLSNRAWRQPSTLRLSSFDCAPYSSLRQKHRSLQESDKKKAAKVDDRASLSCSASRSNHQDQDHNNPKFFYLTPNVCSVANSLELSAVARPNKCSTFASADIRRAIRSAVQYQKAATNSGVGLQVSGEREFKPRARLESQNWQTSECKLGDRDINLARLDNKRQQQQSATVRIERDSRIQECENRAISRKVSAPRAGTLNGNQIENSIEHQEKEDDNSDLSRERCELIKQIYRPEVKVTSASCLDLNKNINKDHSSKLILQAGPLRMSTNLQASSATHHKSTIHSIQSLSMQLDRAASYGGFAHLEQSTTSSSIMSSQSSQNNSSIIAGPLEQQQSSMTSACSQSNLRSSSNKIGRLVGKKALRVKELLLQNLGRADRTTDELFELYEGNFHRQQNQANKLAKEFKQYMAALKGFHEASKSLNKCIQLATSDYQCARHDLVCENLSKLEQLQEDLLEKLREQVMQTVGEYLTQFVELKAKISKRRRKLIDFDSSKRLYEVTLAQVNKKRLKQQRTNESTVGGQTNTNSENDFGMSRFIAQRQSQRSQNESNETLAASELVDEARLLKLREQYNYCRIMYETINSELQEELPIVYEKKMKSLLITLQNYFSLEAHYHSHAGKLLATTSDVIDELPIGLMSRGPQLKKALDEDSSSEADSENGDDDDEDEYRRKASIEQAGLKMIASDATQGGGGLGGGGSSGVGSSRADSSSCPESSSSGAGSPDSAAVQQQHQAANQVGLGQIDGKQPDSGKACVQSAEEQPVGSIIGQDGAVSSDAFVAGSSLESEQQRSAMVTVSEEEHNRAEIKLADAEIECSLKTIGDEGQPMGGHSSNSLEEEGVNSSSQFNSTCVLINEPTSGKIPGAGPETIESEKRSEEKLGEGEKMASILYKVKTNYKYLAEDVDELCFEADEVIQVIEFDETHEPEEGWLLGIRELNGQRGLFPANFTKPI